MPLHMPTSALSVILQRFKAPSIGFLKEHDHWEYTDEPHASRRKEILAKYPEIKQLMGSDSSMLYIVLMAVFIQLVMCWLVKDMSWGPLLLLTYTIGATINHILGVAFHESGHSLVYGHRRLLQNHLLGILANIPMGIPMSAGFKKYHSDHHRYLGDADLDGGIYLEFEHRIFCMGPLARIFWLLVHPLLNGLRPYIKRPTLPNKFEIINICIQMTFNVLLCQAFGPRPLVYCTAGTIFGLGLHPLGAHFICEHYMFTKGQPSVSYYGPLNLILFNVGYHVEHHDFPYVSWRKLPEIRRIAPEYYNNLHYTSSYLKVLWDFISNGPHIDGAGYSKEKLDGIWSMKISDIGHTKAN